MKTVLLIGAGATLAEALPRQPSQSKCPPLDATFFQLCRNASLEGQQAVRRYMGSIYGLNPFIGDHRMEDVFNIIYSDAFSGDPSDECLDAYRGLLELYRGAIRHTTNELDGRSRFGVGGLLRFLLRSGENREFTFITFNQDLVIEKALEHTKGMASYSTIPWNFPNAYGVDFARYLQSGNQNRFFSAQSPSAADVKVLKLHGSMNWVYMVRSASDVRNALRQPSGELLCLNDNRVFAEGRVRPEGGGKRQPFVPLIVPPIYEKSTHLRATLQPAWASARAALEVADEMIVFGYSFPEADIAARNMLRQAFFRNDSVEHVHIIDPSPSSAERVSTMLDAPVVSSYRDVPAFASHYSTS